MGRVGLGRSFIIGSRAVIPFSTTGRYNAGMEKHMDAGGKEAYRSVEAASRLIAPRLVGKEGREEAGRWKKGEKTGVPSFAQGGVEDSG